MVAAHSPAVRIGKVVLHIGGWAARTTADIGRAARNIGAARIAKRRIEVRRAIAPVEPAAMAGAPRLRCGWAAGRRAAWVPAAWVRIAWVRIAWARIAWAQAARGRAAADCMGRVRHRDCCSNFRQSARYRNCNPRRRSPQRTGRPRKESSVIARQYIYAY